MLLGRLGWSHTPYMVLQVRRILLLSLIGLTTGSGTLQIGHTNVFDLVLAITNLRTEAVEKCVWYTGRPFLQHIVHILSLYFSSLLSSHTLAMSLD